MDDLAENQLQQERRNLWVNVFFNSATSAWGKEDTKEPLTNAAKAADQALKAYDKKFSVKKGQKGLPIKD